MGNLGPMVRHLLWAGAAFLVIALSGVPSRAQAATHTAFAPGAVIIKFKADADPLATPMPTAARPATVRPAQLHSRIAAHTDSAHKALAAVLAQYHIRKQATRQADHTYTLHLDAGADVAQAARTLAANPLVAYAEPDYRLQAFKEPNDTFYKDGTQWALQKVGMPAAWDVSTGSAAVTVAVVDTGVRPDHPDLQNVLVPGYNFADNNADTGDDVGHGTHVAGIIAANTNNGIGISGIAWTAHIMPVKVLSSDGGGYDSDFVNGIRYAVDHGARIINTSLGSDRVSQAVIDSVNYALDKGVVFIASSGNDGATTNAANFPASIPGVIAVGASTPSDQVAYFSSYGPSLSLVAPGTDILSLSNGSDGDYSAKDGTSFSAPIVAGVAALMLSADPTMTAQEVRDVLEGTADHIGTGAGRTDMTGFGRLNAGRALAAVKAGDYRPNKKSIIQGVVTDAPADAYALVTPEGRFPIVNGHFTVTGLGNAAYSLAVVSPGAGKVTDTVQVQTSGQPGTVYGVAFNFATGSGSLVPPPSLTAATPADARAAFAPVAATATTADRLYFANTGHTLAEPFKTYWQTHGGLPVFGYAISEPFAETSRTDGAVYLVQYFERNRFEYHPDAPAQFQVLLGLLGSELTKGRTFSPATPLNGGAAFFSQTQHNVSGKFWSYWQANGGLAIFGYPISEPLSEVSTTDGQTYTVQYFERNRFEYHPKNSPPYDVLLGLLGRNLAIARGYISK